MKRKTRQLSPENQNLGIAACRFPISLGEADDAIQLFPSGEFTAPEGALQGEGPWHLDADLAANVISALSTSNHILIDYDHQSLLFTQNHQPLESAGTFSGANLQWRENGGLFATGVEWLAAAKAHFSKGEILYISPLFTYDKSTGAVKNLISVAVTDNPAIKNMRAIKLAAANLIHPPKEDVMNKALLALLGLPENATDDEAIAACKLMQQSAETVNTLTDQVAALKANASANPDPAKFVPIETMAAMQAQIAALSTQINGKECGDLIIAALADGRLLDAQKSWAETLDAKQLKAFLKDAPAIAALKSQQSDGVSIDADGKAFLNTDQLAVCKSMGIEPKDYQAQLLAEQE